MTPVKDHPKECPYVPTDNPNIPHAVPICLKEESTAPLFCLRKTNKEGKAEKTILTVDSPRVGAEMDTEDDIPERGERRYLVLGRMVEDISEETFTSCSHLALLDDCP